MMKLDRLLDRIESAVRPAFSGDGAGLLDWLKALADGAATIDDRPTPDPAMPPSTSATDGLLMRMLKALADNDELPESVPDEAPPSPLVQSETKPAKQQKQRQPNPMSMTKKQAARKGVRHPSEKPKPTPPPRRDDDDLSMWRRPLRSELGGVFITDMGMHGRNRRPW